MLSLEIFFLGQMVSRKKIICGHFQKVFVVYGIEGNSFILKRTG